MKNAEPNAAEAHIDSPVSTRFTSTVTGDACQYNECRKAGLPTTSTWMESAVKEMNYRIKGTEMFWNNPVGAEASFKSVLPRYATTTDSSGQ